MSASFSITAYGVERCNGLCSYCSCASIENYTMGCKKDINALEKIDEYVFNKEYQADWDKVEETLKNHPNVVNDRDKKSIHFDLWGADSSSNLLMVDDMVTHLKDISKRLGYERSSFSTSTNGLGLLRDEVADYHYENKIGIQLSHDGLGQFIRLRDIDVLQFDNTKRMIKEGVLAAINTTLNFYNYDIVENYKYWTDYLKTIFPDVYSKDKMASEKDSFVFRKLYIKLNHIYNGTTPVTSRNDFGIFNGKVYEQLKGQPFGDFNFINDTERANKYNIPEMAHVLDEYMHSYKLMIKELGTLEAIPFYSYFANQLNRFKINENEFVYTGACRAYQRFRHGLEGGKPYTFVVDTLGNFSECNLIYSKYSVKNPGGVHPDSCKGCKYEFASECMMCGCENFPKECHYQYVWNNFLEEVKNGIYRIPKKWSENNVIQSKSYSNK